MTISALFLWGLRMELNIVRLILTFRLEKDVPNPVALFGIKDGFMTAFRQAVDCSCALCANCPRASVCPYYQTFSQNISSDPTAVKRFQKPPLPFAFDFPLLPPAPNRGKVLECGLSLVGTAINFIGDYLAALGILFAANGFGGRTGVSLAGIDAAGYGGERHPLRIPGGGTALDRLVFLSLDGLQGVLSPGSLTISIRTPLRIMHEGRPLREFSFSSFVRALFRRISSLAYYYGGIEMDMDYKWLARRSGGIDCVSADFHWVQWKPSLCGLVGSGTFTGDMTDFLPFILLGEYFHVGKGAPFGLGSYRIEHR